jgi:uncharacterized protein (UPF0333 family)
MVKNKNQSILFLVVILILFIVFYLILNNKKEGFYSNTDTTNAKANIDDLLTNKVSSIITTLTDINGNKFNLDVTSSIASLGNDMPNISSNSKMFITAKKNQLSTIQKNLNNLNDAILSFTGNTMVEQVINITDETSTKKIPILDAISRADSALKLLSKELSEIPE